jgi:hypothetical protein
MPKLHSELLDRYVAALVDARFIALAAAVAVAAIVVTARFRHDERPMRIARGAVLGTAMAGAMVWAWHLRWLCDDAFISFRYAENFARGHIPRLLAVRFGLALVLLGVLGWLYREPAFHQALGLAEPQVGALLAGFALVAPVFMFPLQPLASLMARRQEYEADAFAATHASSASLASALAKLYRDNAATLTPDPLHSLVYDSHPPAALRIDHLKKAIP